MHVLHTVLYTLLLLLLFILLYYNYYFYSCSPYCSLYISQGADKKNLFNNLEFLWLAIISLIVTLMFHTGVILSGEIRC